MAEEIGVRLAQYLKQPDPDGGPIFVYVEGNESMNQVLEAVSLCVRKGLLNWRHGYVVIPAEVGGMEVIPE